MNVPFFSLEKQNQQIGPEIEKAIRDVLYSGNYSPGKRVREFEEKWAALNDRKFCVMCSSGTSALEIALRCLDLEHKTVATTAVSFQATASAISSVSSTPFFIDVDESGNIDNELVLDYFNFFPEDLAQKYPPFFRPNVNLHGLIGVNLYGTSIRRLASLDKEFSRRKVPFILDCAQSHFTTYEGDPVASYGDIATHSFYTTKTLGAGIGGESGCLLMDDIYLYEKAHSLRNHGRNPKYEGDHLYVSSNLRPTELAAAVLLVKLKYAPEWAQRRKEIATRYCDNLNDGRVGRLARNKDTVNYVFPIFSCRRDYLRAKLKEQSIETMIHYPIALPYLTCHGNLPYSDFVEAKRLCETTLSLPFYPELEDSQVDFVCEKVLELAGRHQ